MGALAEMERELIVERNWPDWQLHANRDALADVARSDKRTTWANSEVDRKWLQQETLAIIYDIGVSTIYRYHPVESAKLNLSCNSNAASV